MPGSFDGIDEAPGFFDFITAGEESGVARHGVEKETFVGLGAGFAEGGAVAEIHLHGTKAQRGTRYLGGDAERVSFVWLYSNH